MDANAGSDSPHPLCGRGKHHLESRRRPIQDAIRRYPPPIPACDAHFNHLLEQRSLLSRELLRLEEAQRRGCSGQAAEAFVRSCPCVDADALQGLLGGDRR